MRKLICNPFVQFFGFIFVNLIYQFIFWSCLGWPNAWKHDFDAIHEPMQLNPFVSWQFFDRYIFACGIWALVFVGAINWKKI